ncbi:hydrogenase nickel incorporation protein HypB [Litorivivens sp.]|uniref:hydrogenase nickel incorporation protein HypB n=1 Tax=Litorivivens sp. TaxID=2020868 RepID=UPI0035643B1C
MCTVCGCSDGAKTRINGKTLDNHPHEHNHHHEHTHSQVSLRHRRTVALEQAILSKNDAMAADNRRWFNALQVLCVNLLSSPGSGKTTLLERTLKESVISSYVVEGDQATENDAQRIRATGAKAVQINTGTGCHLEADMLHAGIHELDPKPDSTVFVENVGNLVCPALFDLGEHKRVVILSVTEGEDKPLKYPHMFHKADLVLINKIDLLAYLDFELERCLNNILEVNPDCLSLCISAKSGEGMKDWYDWLTQQRDAMKHLVK